MTLCFDVGDNAVQQHATNMTLFFCVGDNAVQQHAANMTLCLCVGDNAVQQHAVNMTLCSYHEPMLSVEKCSEEVARVGAPLKL